MTKVYEVLNYIETLAPHYMKMDGDNVGLLCGSKHQEVTKILVALDPFEGVCREAAEIGAELIVTHHPLIFKPLSAITDDTSIGRAIQLLCRCGISAINAHTNLDQASGGVNDVLAQALGLQEVRVLTPAGTDENGNLWGLMRTGTVDEQPLTAFLATVKQALHCDGLRYVDGGKCVHKVAVVGGAGGDWMMEAVRGGCDTFISADVKYNQFWDAQDLGMNLIDAGHFHTENPIVAVLANKLQERFPEVSVVISQTHKDCMKFY